MNLTELITKLTEIEQRHIGTFKVGCDPDKNVVAIEYAKPVTWVAMSPKDAVEFAQMLIKHARSISKEPLRVVLN